MIGPLKLNPNFIAYFIIKNFSLRTTLCLQFKPQLIASAAIYLASKYLKYELPEGKKTLVGNF
jgi:hypothetical protein